MMFDEVKWGNDISGSITASIMGKCISFSYFYYSLLLYLFIYWFDLIFPTIVIKMLIIWKNFIYIYSTS